MGRFTRRPNDRRGGAVALAAVVVIAGMVATCSGCGSSTLTSGSAPSSTTASGLDCSVPASPSSVDGVFAPVAGYDSTPICPAEVDSILAGPEATAEFRGITARVIEQNGNAVLRVFAAQLNSTSAAEFVKTYLSDLSARAARGNPPQAVASESTKLGGYQVTYFNVPADGDGYIYAAGPIIVVGYVMSGEVAAAKDAFPLLLANLR